MSVNGMVLRLDLGPLIMGAVLVVWWLDAVFYAKAGFPSGCWGC